MRKTVFAYEFSATENNCYSCEFSTTEKNFTHMNFQPIKKIATHMNFQQMRKIVTHMNIFYPGISGEKIEIDPVGTKGSVKFLRQKAATYPADTIASADVIEEKHGEHYLGFFFNLMNSFE